MDIYELECFLTLTETLHFTKAAEIIHTSPSGLSRIIQRLEQEVGTELFVRNNRSVRLTDPGRQFIPTARLVVQRIQEAKAELGHYGQELIGELKLFATVTACHSLLPELLVPYRMENPGVEVFVHTGDAAHGIEAVLQGQVDVAIVLQPEVPVPRIRFIPLSRTPLSFIAPLETSEVPNILSGLSVLPDEATSSYQGVNWNSVPMILPERGLVREIIDRYFARRFIHPRVVSQVSGNEAIIALVHLGLGIGLVPKLVVQNSPLVNSVRFLPALSDLEPLSISLAVLETRQKLPVVRAFLDQAKEKI